MTKVVEETLKKIGEVVTIAELKRRLPKKVMHQTLLQMLDHLELSGKIIRGTKGILWIYNNSRKLRIAISKGTEI